MQANVVFVQMKWSTDLDACLTFTLDLTQPARMLLTRSLARCALSGPPK
jgi:hypothetical protein